MSTYLRSFALVGALLLAINGWTPLLAQERPAPPPGMSAVDLSRVPIPPADLPESGFQLLLAAHLGLEGLVYSIVGDTSSAEFEGLPFSSMRDGYLSFLTLLADPSDPNTQLAALVTTIAEMDSEGSAEELASRIVAQYELAPSTTVDGVMVKSDHKRNVEALMQRGNHLILVSYRVEEDQESTQQKTERWTAESIAGLAEQTGLRLDDAVAMREGREAALGSGNITFHGDPALETFPPWVYAQVEHYRVLEGAVVPVVGEIEAPSVSGIAPGITDLYRYYLILANEDAMLPGNEDAYIDIRVTLITFETERFASEFAASPGSLVSVYWLPEITYESSTDAGGGVTLARGATEYTDRSGKLEGQIGSGYRAVRQLGRHVVVVEFMATGQVPVTESAVAWLMERQAACMDALPDPCTAVPIDQLRAALEHDATPEATPASVTTFARGWAGRTRCRTTGWIGSA